MLRRQLSGFESRARICNLWSPGIDSEESISPAYGAWRASTTNRVIVPVSQAGNRFLGSLKGLQIRAQTSLKNTNGRHKQRSGQHSSPAKKYTEKDSHTDARNCSKTSVHQLTKPEWPPSCSSLLGLSSLCEADKVSAYASWGEMEVKQITTKGLQA